MTYYILLPFAALVLGCMAEAKKDSAPSEYDFLAIQWAATGAVRDNVRICELLGSGEPIALEAGVVLGLQHFVSARAAGEKAKAQYSVELHLTPEGRRRLKEQTSENVGRQLAMVVEGVVVAMPTVMAPIDTSVIPLPVAGPALADSLAGFVNNAILLKARGK